MSGGADHSSAGLRAVVGGVGRRNGRWGGGEGGDARGGETATFLAFQITFPVAVHCFSFSFSMDNLVYVILIFFLLSFTQT